jgi:DNA polymerase IV (DinB-like DNA polymerase)
LGKVVAFVDLDYFFAQVEEVEKPELAGKPVVVCVYSGRTEDSGVVSTANYPARRYGVKAGIPIKRAKKLLPPEAVFLPIRLQHYTQVSRHVMSILDKYADRMRIESIDEAVLDITNRVGGDFEKAAEYMAGMKTEVLRATGLRCSVGVAPNRVVAKIAADISKPDGLRVVKSEEVEDFLSPLPVNSIPGIGSKAAASLAEMGVKTVEDLKQLSLETLEKLFGRKRAEYVYFAARGKYDEPVEPRPPPKQVSRIITLKRNTRDVDDVIAELSRAVADGLARMEALQAAASRVGAVAITSDLRTITRQAEIRPGASYEEVLKILRKLFQEILRQDARLQLRRAGVRFSDFVSQAGQSTLSGYIE